jgi:hydrogenase nickel incorporation protein HypB
VTKLDLLPYTNFDLQRVRDDMRRLAPEAPVFPVSSIGGEGMDELAGWLRERTAELAGV